MNILTPCKTISLCGIALAAACGAAFPAGFSVYEVPAISSVPQTSGRLGSNAKPADTLQIIATPGEFEPASFVVSPSENIDGFNVEPSSLQGEEGNVISGDNLDVRIVKCWYQAGTAWYSYFADPNRREYVPELLLKDEGLIKVDQETKQNYLRVGDGYRPVSYPEKEAAEFFNYYVEPVQDAKSLQPVSLRKGFNQQYWVTLKVPEGTKPGLYKGTLKFVAGDKQAGQLGVEVRVLPFSLPKPKTYYDLNNDYLVSLYRTDVLGTAVKMGVDLDRATALQKAIYKNLIGHNVVNALTGMSIRSEVPNEEGRQWVLKELRMMREAGLEMRPLITNGWAYFTGNEATEKNGRELFKKRVAYYVDTVAGEVGHHDIYLATFDEAGPQQTEILRDLAEDIHGAGKVKLWMTTAKDRHFNSAGYVTDLANEAGWPDRMQAARWHAVGGKLTNYAGPHTGPENPELFRRWEGLARYKADLDGSFNYKYFSQLHPTLHKKWKENVWNDFSGANFRGFNFVYPTADGVIDTLAWEGFREGIDDIRYATKVKQVAQRAIESDNIQAVYAGRKALLWLELFDAKTEDLGTARLEMINDILEIEKLTNDK